MKRAAPLFAFFALASVAVAQSTSGTITDQNRPGLGRDGATERYDVTRPADWATATGAQRLGPVAPVVHPAGFVNRSISYDAQTGAETIHQTHNSIPQMSDFVPGTGGNGTIPELAEAWGSPSQQNNVTAYPWRTNVRVFFTQGGGSFICSGTLIDARTVITAGHCLHQGGGGAWSTNVSVSAGWDGDDDAFGSANGIQLFSWTAWTSSTDYDWDIGYIRLDRPIGALTGTLGYGYNNANSHFTGNTHHHAAYPGCNSTPGSCIPSFAGCPNQLYYAFGPFDTASTHRLGVNLNNWSMTGGMSGGGEYWINGSGTRIVYGVNSTRQESGCFVVQNGFTRINQTKFDDIQNTVIPGAYGSSLDLIPLDVNSGATAMVGGRLPSFDVLFFNNSSNNPPSDNYTFDVYLSTNTDISTFDTLISSTGYSWNFGPQSSVRVNSNASPPRIPFGTSSGTRWVGVINTTADANGSNDDTDGWDAHQITVIPTPAQLSYDSNIGSPLGAGDDVIINRSLGFTFTWPNGTTSTSIDIDSNGRILPPGSDGSDFTESTAELLSGPTALCPLWDDLTPDGATNTGDIYFRGTGTRAIITWQNVQQFGTDQDFTFQVQLRSDGRIAYIYDSRVDGDAIIGLTGGNGATGSSTNLSGQPATNANTDTLFEQFSTNSDLDGLVVQFNPGPNGDWIVRTSNSTIPLPPPATNEQIGRPCTSSFTITAGVFGTYFGSACMNCWDNNVGTDLGMGDDTIVNTPLGFSFTFPDGTAVTSVDVDSNGRILPPGSDGSDFTPSVAEMLSGPSALYPFHTDLSPNLGGAVRAYQGAGYTTITWWNVPQFGQTNAISVQATLRPDNTVTYSYRNLGNFTPDEVLVGNARGNDQSDPGESDLTALSSSFTNLYEFFDVPGGDLLDLQMTMQADTTPRMGNPWELRLQGVDPNAAVASLLFGFSNPNANLDGLPGLGLDGCMLLCNPAVPAIPMVLGTETASTSIVIDSSTDWIGLTLYAQGAVIAPGTTALGVELSDAQLGIVGY